MANEKERFEMAVSRFPVSFRCVFVLFAKVSVIKRCNPALTAYVALNKITSRGWQEKQTRKTGTGNTSVLIKNYRDGGKGKK